MKNFLMIIGLIAISGCSSQYEKITITDMGEDKTDSAITEVLQEKIK